MRQFRLIKEYPQSIKLGEVVKIDDSTDFLTFNDIIEYPEYWEDLSGEKSEIIEHDSVEREKDKKVFSKGDKVLVDKSYSTWFTIKRIFTFAGITILEGDNYRMRLNGARHGSPMGKTQDGSDFYMYEDVFIVERDSQFGWRVYSHNFSDYRYLNKETMLIFLNREKAINYALENYPCLSYKEIRYIMETNNLNDIQTELLKAIQIKIKITC